MKKIVLFSLALFASAVMALAQNVKVTGTIADEAGNPVSAATVSLKDATTPVYTVSGVDGKFEISVPANGTLEFACFGFKTAVVAVNGQRVLNVTLVEALEQLQETVVVAFGTSTKEAFTGSAKVLSDETLANSQVTSVTEALSGQVAGVQLVSNNGAPGAKSTIRIRGISSVNAGKDPLVIVDGAPFDGDINTISPNDIESMTVLKDAASNALYGARGANGVIMITTKKAKKGTSTVTLDIKVGANSKAVQQYEVINSTNGWYEQHYKALQSYYVNEKGMSAVDANVASNAVIFDGNNGGTGYPIYAIPEGQTLIGLNGKINPNAKIGNVLGDFYLTPDDWSKAAYRTGLRQEYNLNISGAYDKFSVYASISYLNNQGIVEKSDYNRLATRLKAEYQAKEWLKVGANLAYTKYGQNSLKENGDDSSSVNVLAFTQLMAPIFPLYVRNADGSQYYDSNNLAVLDYGNGQLIEGGVPGTTRPFISNANPIFGNRYNTNNVDGNAISANASLEFKLYDGLTAVVNATAFVNEARSKAINNSYYGQFRPEGGSASVVHQRTFAYNFQQLLNYKKEVAKDHNIDIMVGHENYVNEGYVLYGAKSTMFSPENTELDGFVNDNQNAGSYKVEYNNEGYFFRAQYNYAERYFVSGSYRRDASSKFHPDNRWGNFWSAGAAWIMSKEKWFKAPVVDELKLKASVGSQGNDDIGSYRYTDTYDIVPSDGQVSTIFSTKGNKDITWETNTNINAGVEFSLLKGKIDGSVEYFNRLTTNMLFRVNAPPSQGYSYVWQNIGSLSNQGLEVDLHFTPIKTKNVTWDINANLTYQKNSIVSLSDKVKSLEVYDTNLNKHAGLTSAGFFLTEGTSMYTWYTYEYAGLDDQGQSMWYKVVEKEVPVSEEEGAEVVKVISKETTTARSEATKFLTGKTTLAPVYGGFGTSLKAYGVDFTINFTYQLGGSQWDGTYQTFMGSPNSSIGSHYHVDLLNAWTPENTNTDVPRFQYLDSYTAAASTRWLTSARYLNLQNINVGYTLPERITKKFLVSSLRIYFSAENVWYWSARQGFDPRQSYTSSTTATNYSPMRTLSGGITVKF